MNVRQRLRLVQPAKTVPQHDEDESIRLLRSWTRARLRLAVIRLDERLRMRGAA